MGIFETLIFYGVIGAGVSVALLASEASHTTAQRVFLAATAIVFWPIYVPVLLGGQRTFTTASRPPTTRDNLDNLVSQVEEELDEALAGIDRIGDKSLVGQLARLTDLRQAWTLHAERIRDMDEVLSKYEQGASHAWTPASTAQRVTASEQARRANVDQLRELRRAAYDELMSSLAGMREFISLLHLSRFTGESMSRAEKLALQLSAALLTKSKEQPHPHRPPDPLPRIPAAAFQAPPHATTTRPIDS